MVWFISLIVLINNSCQKLDDKPRVLVLAHAGMSLFEERAILPANSFEVIKHSVNVLGSEGIEIDVQMTKDSVLVLFHDANITTSPGFSGCIGNYNWNVIKDLKLNNSNYNLARLDSVMDFLIENNVKVFLDLKPFNFCENANKSYSAFANCIDSIMNKYDDDQKKLVIAGSFNVDLLNSLNVIYKCVERTNVDAAIELAEMYDYQYLMLPISVINDTTAEKLKNTPFNWGVFGGKSNGEIRKTIGFKPSCFISDNFVYTQKITD